jgi:hypothetical protein
VLSPSKSLSLSDSTSSTSLIGLCVPSLPPTELPLKGLDENSLWGSEKLGFIGENAASGSSSAAFSAGASGVSEGALLVEFASDDARLVEFAEEDAVESSPSSTTFHVWSVASGANETRRLAFGRQ